MLECRTESREVTGQGAGVGDPALPAQRESPCGREQPRPVGPGLFDVRDIDAETICDVGQRKAVDIARREQVYGGVNRPTTDPSSSRYATAGSTRDIPSLLAP